MNSKCYKGKSLFPRIGTQNGLEVGCFLMSVLEVFEIHNQFLLSQISVNKDYVLIDCPTLEGKS